MVWALLVFLGVPLWICAAGIIILIVRNRSIKHRAGNIPVRVLRPGKSRWMRGHAIWVSDVFAASGGAPRPGVSDLAQVHAVALHDLDETQRKKLHRLGPDAAIATLSLAGGGSLEVATDGEHAAALAGPFASPGEAAEAPVKPDPMPTPPDGLPA